jgi:hypothetical protein
MRFAAVWQEDDEEQSAVFVQLPKDSQRLPFEWMLLASDRDTIRMVPDVGSLWWFPSTKSDTIG